MPLGAAAAKRPVAAPSCRGAEGDEHVCADLERVGADAGTEPGATLARRAPAALHSALDRRFDHTRGKAAPAGMRRSHGAPVRRREQHRQAVGGLDRAGDARDSS